MMRAQHVGICAVCARGYTIGERIEQMGMADVGTPRQRWLFRHATCPKALVGRR